jgi:methyltransferase (TIGR00027 family)
MSQQGEWDIVSGIGLTALGAAAGRAIETSRPDRLIEDPLAAAFIDAAQSPIPMAVRWPAEGEVVSETDALLVHGSHYIGLRSRFFDDYLATASAGDLRQVVVLGAGLDTRAFRLDWPDGVRLFEVDRPTVLEFKEAVLRDTGAQARCERRVVAVDLVGDWAAPLRAAGFDPAAPAAWLAEGLLPYLPAGVEERLFEQIDAHSATGSHLAVEHTVEMDNLMDSSGLNAIREVTGFDLGGLHHTEDRREPAAWLAGRGWRVADEPAAGIAQRYGRNLTDPRLDRLPGTPLHVAEHAGFLSAHRTG